MQPWRLSTSWPQNLGQKRKDCDTSVPSDNRDVHILEGEALELGNEGVGANDVKSGDTNDLPGVIDPCSLENLGSNGNRGVDRV